MKNNFRLPASYERKIKEKRGLGTLASYKPWLEVHEVPSKGRSLRVKGWKTGRVHHLLSDLESNFFFMLEWDDDVTDIREQFPLDFLKTTPIARDLKIIHPRNTRTQELHIMTTDMLVNYGEEQVAYSCKYKKDIGNKRVNEKMMLEKLYWERQGIQFEIITEEDICKELVRNVRLVRECKWLNGIEPLPSLDARKYILRFFDHELTRKKTPLAITNQIDQEFELPVGTAMCLFRHFIANKNLLVNMNKEIKVTKEIDYWGAFYD